MAKGSDSLSHTDQQRLDLLANLILEILENETAVEESHELD
jgi:hypothetical protein